MTQYAYDPFGNVTITGEISDNPFQYTGRENDGTGLYYYRARYYSPELQRFISEDPIGFAGRDINFYSYTHNNPVHRTDSLGLDDGWGWWCGWPWNGNLKPGYERQDDKCTVPGNTGDYLNNNSCTKKCCKMHDDCYRTFAVTGHHGATPCQVLVKCAIKWLQLVS